MGKPAQLTPGGAAKDLEGGAASAPPSTFTHCRKSRHEKNDHFGQSGIIFSRRGAGKGENKMSLRLGVSA